MKRWLGKWINRIKNGVKYILFWSLCLLLPIRKDRIVVVNYYGRGYGDNAKYIVDKLLGKSLQIIWLVKNKKEEETLPEGVTPCRYLSYRSIYYLATAKLWLDNSRKPYILRKRKNQLYIQTWHGGGAQKKCERDVESALSPSYVRAAKRDAAASDLMISDGRFMSDLYLRSFWYDGPVFESGYPRYDILLGENADLKKKVCAYYNIDEICELVLYAPTFRVDSSFDAYRVDFGRLQKNLKQRFGKDFVVLVHLHPNVANVEGGIEYDGVNVINSTFYPDTQELVATASVLIGDYSSINYDFCLRRLPVFRFTTDLAAYRNDRDLYFSFEEYPYPYAESNDELEELVLHFDEEAYLKTLNAFFRRIGSVIRSDSADEIAQVILSYMSHGSKEKLMAEYGDKFYRGEARGEEQGSAS